MSARCSLITVSKCYGRRVALSAVSMSVHAGEILGLVGRNGAGKTTLLRVAAGLVAPTTGVVERPAMRRGALRYFAGERALPPDVRARAWWRLWTGRSREDLGPARIGTLSRGTRQRLGLETTLSARTFDGDPPDLLLLDEPWEGLDPDQARWLSRELLEKRRAGTAVLVSSHRIHDLADVCDRCVFLRAGRVGDDIVMCPPVGVGVDRSAFLFDAFDRMRE